MHNTKGKLTRELSEQRKEFLTESIAQLQSVINDQPHPLEKELLALLLWQFLEDDGGSIMSSFANNLRLLANRMLLDDNDDDRFKTFATFMSVDSVLKLFLTFNEYRLMPSED